MNSKSGIHWRNDPWAIEYADFAKLDSFRAVEVILYTYGGVDFHLERQRGLCWRLHGLGLELYYRLDGKGWPKSAERYVDQWAAILATLPPGPVQMDNEPNHPGEGFGGSAIDMATPYSLSYLGRLNRFREAALDIKLVFPGLAVAQNDIDWANICAPAIRASDYLGCHVYWQYDNWQSLDWGRRYEVFHALYPDKPLLITEYGDSTSGRPIEQKAWTYAAWLSELPAYVERAFCYILSSPDPTWAEFALTPEACRIITTATEREDEPDVPEKPEFHFGFKKLYDSNPAEVGKPIGQQKTIPNAFSFQFTEKGLLLYDPESNTNKFFRQTL